MSGFKLLAIAPLNGCDSKFTKNLKIGEVYKFYQGFDIKCIGGDTLQYFENSEAQSQFNLYELKNGISLNISAIVGLNGSGKSSLIELFYYFIYKLATTQKAYGKEPIEKYSYILQNLYSTHVGYLEKLKNDNTLLQAAIIQNRLELLIQNVPVEKLESLSDDEFIDEVKRLVKDKTIYLYKEWQGELEVDSKIENSLNVGIVYETDFGVFSVVFRGSKLNYECLKSYCPTNEMESIEFKLENFFYSISLNFSHHSLNNKTLGNWINSLFHKNDGYTTPVVINPMRHDGSFDVNREIKLNNERLMSTIAYIFSRNNEAKLLEKYKIRKFIFRVKKSITPIFCKGLKQRSEKMKTMNNHFSSSNEKVCVTLSENDFYNSSAVKMILKHIGIDRFEYDFPFLNYAIGYLENKIPKLKDTYPQFFSSTGEIEDSKFEKFLEEDTSHITKKIRQTLNFLKVVYNTPSTIWESPTTYLSNHIDINNFKSWLETNNPDYESLSSLQLMEFALPGFFSVDFELLSMDSKPLKLSELSSGEQQMLFNINTIVYHLLNLQSVPNDNSDENHRIAYKNVAVILDEIELYYHPDMQRKLVKNTIEALEIVKNKHEAGIEAINLCFLTHSSFILSDIPKSNIMHLSLNENGNAVVSTPNEETFGANIHDLLANDFFLKDGFMGEFAQEKINDLINFLTYNPKKKNKNNVKPNNKWTDETAKEFIGLIGEPLLKYDLKEMFLSKFYDITELDKQIELLQKVKNSKTVVK
jgi:hypothetical protein